MLQIDFTQLYGRPCLPRAGIDAVKRDQVAVLYPPIVEAFCEKSCRHLQSTVAMTTETSDMARFGFPRMRI
jgi:hypothetical protein